MKRVLLASTALVFVGHTASAASPPRFSWTGCYIGGHVGFGWSQTDIAEPLEPQFQYFAPAGSAVGVDTGTHTVSGGQVGCDAQFAQNWLVGIGGDYSFADLNGETLDPFFSGKGGRGILISSRTDWLSSLTGRVGYAWDRIMVYGKGGAAWAGQRYGATNLVSWGNPVPRGCSSPSSDACNPTGGQTRAGWVIGGGIEAAFAGNWTAGFEYAHYDLGSAAVTLTDPNAIIVLDTSSLATGPVNVKSRIDTARFTLNYRFGWPLHR